jgi:hypothetical protein
MDDSKCWNKHGEEGVNDRDQVQAIGQHDVEEGLHETCAGGEEAPFGNQDLYDDDDVAEIAANPVHTVENLEEMVRGALGFEKYTSSEFRKLKKAIERYEDLTISEL